MSLNRVALIFDNVLRPDTTGVYCRRALGKLLGVDHYLPSQISQIDPNQYDLFLTIDDSLSYTLPDQLRPNALWAIDTHINYERTRQRVEQYDFVFAAQRAGASRLQQDGHPSVTWLPLACDPDIHTHKALPKQYDIGFVGHVFPGKRAECLQLIEGSFPRSFIGQTHFTNMAGIYAASRIVFNRSLRDDINMRVFEGLASGSLLLTNNLPESGQSELFQEGHHFAGYGSEEEFLEKAGWYLQHESQREAIARAGRDLVLAQHTYRHRMQQLLETIEKAGSTVIPSGTKPESIATHLTHKKHRSDQHALNINQLRETYPWPEQKPQVSHTSPQSGWLEDGARELLEQELTSEHRIVVELGSWLGLSTRFIADHAPGAIVIAIDHWEGSPEHHQHEQWRELLPTLYETFSLSQLELSRAIDSAETHNTGWPG